MPHCAVAKCLNGHRKGLSFHRFPLESNIYGGPNLRAKWARFCGHGDSWTPETGSRICGDHFDHQCFTSPYSRSPGVVTTKRLKPGSLPTLNPPPSSSTMGSTISTTISTTVTPSPALLLSPTSVQVSVCIIFGG